MKQHTYKSTNKNSINIELLPFMLILLPVISAIVILISARSPNLQGLFAILERISGGFGFHSDYGWLWRAVLFFPFLSVAYYIGFTMLKYQQQTFGIQSLRLSIKALFIFVFSCFLIGVGWVIAVYVSKVMNFMDFYGNLLDRVATLTNQYPYTKAYSLLKDYIWANLVCFYITLAIFSIAHLVLSKTIYPSKIEPFFSEYISNKASANKKSEGLKSSEDEYKELQQRLKNIKKFLPQQYFKDGQIFLCKDIDTNKPIYLNDKLILDKELKHVAIVGSSGSGKSVFSQSFLVQMITKGFPVVAFDPNQDEHMMKNLKYNAEKMDKKFHWINFNEYDNPQIDLLQGCNSAEFRALTNLLFPALAIKETDGNYYSQFSRDARSNFYEPELEGVKSMYDLHCKVFKKYGEEALLDETGKLPQFVNEWRNFAKVPMFKVADSLSIADALNNGDVIYISCPDMSADDEITYLCKAFFLRVLQIISKDNPKLVTKHIFLFVDEFADFINKTMKGTIEKVRKKGCTLLMNMTSFENLDGISKDIKGSAVIDTVKINTIKLIYQQPHEEISAKASNMTGQKIIKVERHQIKRNEALKELEEVSETTQFAQKTNVFSSTLIENLPAKVGILIGVGLPKLVQTEVLKYPADTKYPNLIEATPYQEDKKPIESNDIMGAL
ncbi:DUF87 domain-containing protein [Francisella sp. LA112445]|uniref:helicase HerA domain-containing protein n=1 Tax=Francisella sp. LA112445 TaxID=1395624 RepID=UPI001788C910|nr:DUF87 domain-containing protein [Francisella sp. LA112445]QIW10137.1 DUF87 domain-containing protein [Francisella sp. LA112445]